MSNNPCGFSWILMRFKICSQCPHYEHKVYNFTHFPAIVVIRHAKKNQGAEVASKSYLYSQYQTAVYVTCVACRYPRHKHHSAMKWLLLLWGKRFLYNRLILPFWYRLVALCMEYKKTGTPIINNVALHKLVIKYYTWIILNY